MTTGTRPRGKPTFFNPGSGQTRHSVIKPGSLAAWTSGSDQNVASGTWDPESDTGTRNLTPGTRNPNLIKPGTLYLVPGTLDLVLGPLDLVLGPLVTWPGYLTPNTTHHPYHPLLTRARPWHRPGTAPVMARAACNGTGTPG